MVAGLITGSALAQASKQAPNTVKPTIVTQDNFPQAFTNMRFGAILKKTGGVNKFFAMPVPSSTPAEQFVVRMNRDTPNTVRHDICARKTGRNGKLAGVARSRDIAHNSGHGCQKAED